MKKLNRNPDIWRRLKKNEIRITEYANGTQDIEILGKNGNTIILDASLGITADLPKKKVKQ